MHVKGITRPKRADLLSDIVDAFYEELGKGCKNPVIVIGDTRICP